MPLDPSIPLQTKAPNIGGGILQFVQMKQAQEDRAQRGKLVDLQAQQAQLQIDEFKKNQATRLWNNLSERDQARAKSVAIASAQVNALLGANDVEGAKNFLLQRQQTLEQAGIDTTETQEMLSMLEQDPQKALDASTKMVEFGQRLGFLQTPKQEGFTLGQGQTRFDSQGQPIASVEQKPKLLTPEEEAQQVRIRAAGANRTEINLTPGQKSADQAFGKEYTQFVAAGGFADIKKNIDQLKLVRDELSSGKNLTGPITGSTPDWIRKFTNARSLAVRDAVEEVVQRNLRLILGAQFTEKEGERLIKRSYNEDLPEEENIKRLDRLIGQIETAARAKQEAVEYFEQRGTLQGFNGKIFSTADFMNDAVPVSGQAASPEQIDELLKKYGPTR